MGGSTLFLDTSSEYLGFGGAGLVTSDYPITFTTWVAPQGGGFGDGYLTLTQNTASNNAFFIGQGTGVFMAAFNADAASRTFGTTSYTLGTWYHVAGLFRSATDRELYVNGISEKTDIDSIAFPVGMDTVVYGSVKSSSQHCDANLAYSAIYNRSLSVAEISECMHNPRSIVDGLIFYVPGLVEAPSTDGDYVNLVDGQEATVGTIPSESFDGPPVFFPQSKR